MRILVSISILIAFNFVFHHQVIAQQQPVKVEISSNKVIIDGQIYYVHIVEKGQTIYSISRAYNVTEEEIVKHNVGAGFGIKEGQALKIPIKKEEVREKVEKENRRSKRKERGMYIEHTVQAGQTLYFISRKYNVAIDELLAHNPAAEFGIKPGDEIKVPRADLNSLKDTLNKGEFDDVLYHKVEKSETLYSLARHYKIDIEDLITENPKLAHGLKHNDTIKIPVVAEKKDSILTETKAFIETDTLGHPVYFNCRIPPFHSQKLKVAIMLPFNILEKTVTKENEEGETIPTSEKELYLGKNASFFIEFYEGILLAADSLKKLGQNIELFVYDTHKDTNVVKRILTGLEGKEINMIIGPVFTKNLELAAQFALENRIPLVSPLAEDAALLSTNPYYIQVLPSSAQETAALANLAANYNKNNIVLVHDGNPLFAEEIFGIRDNLFNAIAEHNLDPGLVNFKEIIVNDSLRPSLERALKNDTRNIVIFPSTREAYISPLVQKLNLVADRYDIMLLGFSEFQKFPSIDDNYFHRMNLHHTSPFFMDYDDKTVVDFLAKYRRLFSTEPVQFTSKGYNFTLLGYDIGFYFFNAFKQFGPSMLGCLEEYYVPLLLSEYHFVRVSPYGGFENQYVNLVKYTKDYKVNKVRN